MEPFEAALLGTGLFVFLVLTYVFLMFPVFDYLPSLEIKKYLSKIRFKKLKFKQTRTDLLLITTRKLIKAYEKHSHLPSCEDDIMKIVNAMVSQSRKELDEYPEEIDVVKVAHSWLINFSFDLLTSGRYHLYAETLNPLSCAENLMDVYKASMEYAVKSGEINEETKKEQYELLLKGISQF